MILLFLLKENYMNLFVLYVAIIPLIITIIIGDPINKSIDYIFLHNLAYGVRGTMH